MASNVQKAWKNVQGVWDSATKFTQKHPVIGTAASIVSANPYVIATNIGGQFRDSNTKNTSKTTYSSINDLQGYDEDALYRLYGGGMSSGGGGGYDVAKADISGLLSAYEQQAESARQVAESRYNNTRNDLLTSLKRFQEQNAKDVQNQKQGYLSEQANLESAREQANRQNRISAAARGIGGSGLQQLAQLQNLMSQSSEVSQAANKNQTAMDKLATLLREYEEDNATKMQRNEDERMSTLNSIASTLATQKAQAIAENEQRYVNALNSARAQAASASASSNAANATARQAATAATGVLALLTKSLDNELQGLKGMSASKLKAYMNDNYGIETSNMNTIRNLISSSYLAQLAKIQEKYPFDAATTNTVTNNINALLNNLKYKK